jgi:glycopeptide antibiotics resistance protein
MRSLSRTTFALYLITLLWLVLFKFSYDLQSIVLNYQARSLSLVPFAGYSQGNLREMIDNVIVFVPFGLLLSANFKRVAFWQKLATVFTFSLAVEIIQFILAIGITDTTDVILNTLGGLIGLTLYDLSKKQVDSKKMDRFIVIVSAVLLIAILLLRVLVFKIRY